MYSLSDYDDSDTCGCIFGKACAYHKEQQDRTRAEWEAICDVRGINPYADIRGLEEIALLVQTSPHLSDAQKNSIMRIMFPAVR